MGALAFSSDQLMLASIGEDDFVRVWDVQSRTLLKEFQFSTDRSFRSLRIEFSPDNQFLVAGASFSKYRKTPLRVWQVKTWEEIPSIEKAGFPVVFHGEQNQIVALTRSGFRAWRFEDSQFNLTSENPLPVQLKEMESYLPSTDGSLLAVQNKHTIQIWNTHLWQMVAEREKSSGVSAISSDLEYIASVPGDWHQLVSELQVNLFKPFTGEEIKLEEAQPGFLFDLEFSPDSKWLAAGGWDYLIHFWQPENGKKVGVLKGHLDEIFCIKFAGNSQTLASGSKDGTIYLWDVRSIVPPDNFEFVEYPNSRREERIGSIDKLSRNDLIPLLPSALISEFQNRNFEYYLPRTMKGSGTRVSPDGKYIARRVNDKQVEIWNIDSGKFRTSVNIPKSRRRRFGREDFDFLSNNLFLYKTGDSTSIWDLEKNRLDNHRIPKAMGDWKGASRDSQLLAFLNEDAEYSSRVVIWNLKHRRKQSELIGLNDPPMAIVFSPDGKLATATSFDKRAIIWKVDTGEIVHQLTGHKQGITSASFSHDQRTLVTSSPDGTVRFWHLATGREMLSFSPGGRQDWHLEFSRNNNALLLKGFKNALLMRVPDLKAIDSSVHLQ